MKERALNFLKWFFIILGVLFFIQLVLLSGIFIGFNSIKEPDFKIKPINTNYKELQPVIDYAEKYREENNKYPENVDIKLKKGEYRYETSNNSNCFKVVYTNKKSEKTYECCTINTKNSNSKQESFSEVVK